jgi:hypothetical protein
MKKSRRLLAGSFQYAMSEGWQPEHAASGEIGDHHDHIDATPLSLPRPERPERLPPVQAARCSGTSECATLIYRWYHGFSRLAAGAESSAPAAARHID